MGTVVTFTDITQRKEREAQLVQPQKMEVVGQLTGSIAHDFQQPVDHHLDQSPFPGGEAGQGGRRGHRRASRDAESAAQDGASLTRRLLTFARRHRLETAQDGPRCLHPTHIALPAPHNRPEHRADRETERRASARACRPTTARERDPQPGHQRPGRDAGRRHPDDRGQAAIGRHRGGVIAPGVVTGRLCGRQRLRHRDRYVARAVQTCRRALLYDQAGPQGQRAWPELGAGVCPAVRRRPPASEVHLAKGTTVSMFLPEAAPGARRRRSQRARRTMPSGRSETMPREARGQAQGQKARSRRAPGKARTRTGTSLAVSFVAAAAMGSPNETPRRGRGGIATAARSACFGGSGRAITRLRRPRTSDLCCAGDGVVRQVHVVFGRHGRGPVDGAHFLATTMNAQASGGVGRQVGEGELWSTMVVPFTTTCNGHRPVCRIRTRVPHGDDDFASVFIGHHVHRHREAGIVASMETS